MRRAAPSPTLDRAAARFLAGVEDGSLRNRSGDLYKPSAVRGYEQALRLRLIPALGPHRLSEIGTADLRRLVVEPMQSQDADPSTIRNTINAVRVLYRDAIERGEVASSPVDALRLPAVRGRRERIVSPSQAAALIGAVSDSDQALWAAAFYTGLRRGELQALAWSDVNLDGREIRVQRAWDVQEGVIEPKSEAGTRTVPIIRGLREHLLAHRLRQGRGGTGLVFGRAVAKPFTPNVALRRARKAWGSAELEGVTLHDCRHTFASLMIAAGVNAKALSVLMGHASITITLDRYGHLLPGAENEAGDMLDAFLARSEAVAPALRG